MSLSAVWYNAASLHKNTFPPSTYIHHMGFSKSREWMIYHLTYLCRCMYRVKYLCMWQVVTGVGCMRWRLDDYVIVRPRVLSVLQCSNSYY
jgi:hypothetical protein